MKFQRKLNKTLLFLLFILNANMVTAQERTDYPFLDSLSYAGYLEKDWKTVLKISRIARKNEIDYYYMRMRSGIARFERKNYILAEKEFRKADKLSGIEKVNKEYIYYSKLYSGKADAAFKFFDNNRNFLEDRISVKTGGISDIFVSSTAYFSTGSTPEELISTDIAAGINGGQFITNSYFLANFLMSHRLSGSLNLTHGGSFFNKSVYYYLQNGGTIYETNLNNLRQYQYYGGLNFHTASDFSANASIHLLNYQFPSLMIRERGSGIGSYIAGTSDFFYSARFSANQYMGLFNLDAGLSVSNLNKKTQFQHDYQMTFYPLGNLNLYFMSRLIILNENDNTGSENFLRIKSTMGFKTFSKLWVEAEYQTGEMENYNDFSGTVIYNSNETLLNKYRISFIVPLPKIKLAFTGSYSESYNEFFDFNNELYIPGSRADISGFTLTGSLQFLLNNE